MRESADGLWLPAVCHAGGYGLWHHSTGAHRAVRLSLRFCDAPHTTRRQRTMMRALLLLSALACAQACSTVYFGRSLLEVRRPRCSSDCRAGRRRAVRPMPMPWCTICCCCLLLPASRRGRRALDWQAGATRTPGQEAVGGGSPAGRRSGGAHAISHTFATACMHASWVLSGSWSVGRPCATSEQGQPAPAWPELLPRPPVLNAAGACPPAADYHPRRRSAWRLRPPP